MRSVIDAHNRVRHPDRILVNNKDVEFRSSGECNTIEVRQILPTPVNTMPHRPTTKQRYWNVKSHEEVRCDWTILSSEFSIRLIEMILSNVKSLSHNRQMDYQASSPDEKALVEGCAKVGFLFTGEINSRLKIKLQYQRVSFAYYFKTYQWRNSLNTFRCLHRAIR